MSMNEAITNVIDHSETNDYYVCCRTYPSLKQIRLCIADLGIGIRSSLTKKDTYRYITKDREAIKLATEEGVSSREERAGLGLSHIKKFLMVNRGQLCIISCKGKVFWKFNRGEVLEQKMRVPFHGTIIKMIINANRESFYFLKGESDFLL